MYFLYICSALLPVILILIYIYKKDKFPEPKGVVFLTFILGCSTVLAIDYIIPLLDNFGQKNLLLMEAMESAVEEGYSSEYNQLIRSYFLKLQKTKE